MRPPLLSVAAYLFVASVALAQNAGNAGRGATPAPSSGDTTGSAPTLPVGQTFKQFEFPVYEGLQLKYTLFATTATGVTLNRAETTNLKIDIYDNGTKTTTITSPKADLYVAEQKMRTKNTVLIERDDMEAKSQDCDFDVKAKKFLLRTRVHVLLKHFDVGSGAPGNAKPGQPAAAATSAPTSTPAPIPEAPTSAPMSTPAPVPEPAPAASAPMSPDQSMLASPGAISDTNAAPLPPASSTTK
jgi:hypothetical protein